MNVVAESFKVSYDWVSHSLRAARVKRLPHFLVQPLLSIKLKYYPFKLLLIYF